MGPWAGPWRRSTYAPSFREMCCLALLDVTGNGRKDVVLVEAEYVDGRLSWFECPSSGQGPDRWVEHPIDIGINFGHSIAAWRDGDRLHVFLGEMSQGGYGAPPNRDALLLEYTSADNGRTWDRRELYRGMGTHQATVCDVDRDGRREVVGKDCYTSLMQIWKRSEAPHPLDRWQHRLLDREKPYTATDILAADVDGDGRDDVVCGAWWYRNPTWERYTIPGIYQVHTAYDIDGDGRLEFVASKARPGADQWYQRLGSEFCWLKAVDPVAGRWQEYPVGQGVGDWAHGMTIAPLLPGGRPALLVGYHDADEAPDHYPELYEIPSDPRQGPWPRRVLAEIRYGEELAVGDINGDGQLDVLAGPYWLENRGDGTFMPHQIVEGLYAARLRLADIDGDGRLEALMGEEVLDFEKHVAPLGKIAWFRPAQGNAAELWTMQAVDLIRCPHSLDAADLDGDGQLEIVAAEHDPFWPYRAQCRLIVYKRADPGGRSWVRHLVDDRFEHHDGAKVTKLAAGRWGIISHGWTDSRYVHLWELV
ncbi:MAG: FG-GAP repeat domain-containing protein [Thiobacillaceae bacterium]